MPAHKLPDGRWAVWVSLGTDPVTGRRIRRRREGRTKREAEVKAAELRARHERGEDVNAKPRTLGELLDDWIATLALLGKAENTILAYRRAIKNQLKPRLGGVPVPRLRLREMQPAFNAMAETLEASYIQQIRTVLVQALDFAIEHGDRTDNPAKSLRIPKVRRKIGRSLTSEEVQAVLAAAEGHRYGLAVQLALLGLRRAELSGLRWEDFDEQAGTLRVARQIQRKSGRWEPKQTKQNRARMLTLGPRVIAALQLYRRAQQVEQQAMGWQDSGYIFISTRTGGVCPPSTIYDAFKEIATAAGIKPARLHDCRHTAATTLLAGGEDIATVGEVLGHASPQVTAAVYAHALPHKVASASRRLEDIYTSDESRQRHAR